MLLEKETESEKGAIRAQPKEACFASGTEKKRVQRKKINRGGEVR